MAKVKKFKLYTHNSRFLRLEVKSSNFIASFFLKLFQPLYGFFYYIGLALVWAFRQVIKNLGKFFYFVGNQVARIFLKIFTELKNDYTSTRKILPKRFKRLFNPDFIKNFSVFFAVAVAAWGVIWDVEISRGGF